MRVGMNLTSIRPRGRARALREAVFEVSLAGWSAVYGVVVVTDRYVPDVDLTGPLAGLPVPLSVALGGLYIAGGGIVLASFLCRSRALGDLMTMEKVGLSLLGGAWAGYGTAIGLLEPERVGFWAAAIGAVAACGIRWTVVRAEGAKIRADMTEDGR